MVLLALPKRDRVEEMKIKGARGRAEKKIRNWEERKIGVAGKEKAGKY